MNKRLNRRCVRRYDPVDDCFIGPSTLESGSMNGQVCHSTKYEANRLLQGSSLFLFNPGLVFRRPSTSIQEAAQGIEGNALRRNLKLAEI